MFPSLARLIKYRFDKINLSTGCRFCENTLVFVQFVETPGRLAFKRTGINDNGFVVRPICTCEMVVYRIKCSNYFANDTYYKLKA